LRTEQKDCIVLYRKIVCYGL